MGNIFTAILSIIWGMSSGFIISGGVVAFISIIGAIPIMATRTKTERCVMRYETAIMIGSVLGSILYIWQPYMPLPKVFIIILSFSYGVFIGVLIIALAEVLDVFPILNSRIKIKKGIYLIAIALALGKLVGSLYYWLYPVFTKVI